MTNQLANIFQDDNCVYLMTVVIISVLSGSAVLFYIKEEFTAFGFFVFLSGVVLFGVCIKVVISCGHGSNPIDRSIQLPAWMFRFPPPQDEVVEARITPRNSVLATDHYISAGSSVLSLSPEHSHHSLDVMDAIAVNNPIHLPPRNPSVTSLRNGSVNSLRTSTGTIEIAVADPIPDTNGIQHTDAYV